MKVLWSTLNIFLVLIALVQGAIDTSSDKILPCPRDCKCQYLSDTAMCRLLDPTIQRFRTNIKAIVVEPIDDRTSLVLDAYVFKNITHEHLQRIKIINATIERIDPLAFDGLPRLSSVELKYNGLRSINPNLFVNNKALKKINLDGNPIEHKYENLINSPFVEEIIISHANITHLNDSSFANVPNAVYIDLSNNRISKIQGRTFSKLSNLEDLDLSNNYIKTLPQLLFVSNRELTSLKLANNSLRFAETINSESLEILDLSFCHIQKITENTFTDVPSLTNLKLTANKLQSIDVRSFERLIELKDLDLSHNDLSFIPAELFMKNTKLININFSYNPYLKELPAQGFVTQDDYLETSTFDASYCSIERISDFTFVTMQGLTNLYLQANKIEHIPDKLLFGLISLRDVNLSNNRIKFLNSSIFETNRAIRNLNLSNNPLKYIHDHTFENLQNLITLDLSYCELSEFDWVIPESTLDRLTALQLLNISNNNLQMFNPKLLPMIPNIQQLDISSNPLECNKEFASLIQWLVKNNVQVPHDEPTHMANIQMLTESNGELTQKIGWNQLAKNICKDKPLVQVTTSTETTEKIDDSLFYEDDYSDYTQYDDLTTKSIDMLNDNDDKDDDEDEDDIDDLDNDLDDDVTEEVKATLLKYANYTNLIMFLIGAITSATIVFLMAWLIKVYRTRRPTNIFVATLQPHGRTKKDCGIVYKQLSEELTAPKTPIFAQLYEPQFYRPNNQRKLNGSYQEMKPDMV